MNLTVSSVPKPAFTAVANAASYVNGPVSPGENIVIFGTGLGPATLTVGRVTGNAFDTTLADTQVFFDNTARADHLHPCGPDQRHGALRCGGQGDDEHPSGLLGCAVRSDHLQRGRCRRPVSMPPTRRAAVRARS